ncbi:hypothetical protein Q8F55_004115 [Vanrija albida]|uniref:Uncharacterized protein n=1 Tax=Vanrija albida TaxID=181172 RepID=A0ABR3Q681_9TREE
MLAALFTTLTLAASATAAPWWRFADYSYQPDGGSYDDSYGGKSHGGKHKGDKWRGDDKWKGGDKWKGDKNKPNYGSKWAPADGKDAAWNNNGTGFVAPPASFVLPLPADQTNLTIPDGHKVTIATASRGVQNYTCTNGVWVPAGALANLYDAGLLLALTENFAPAQKVTDGLSPLFLAAQEFPSSDPTPSLLHEFVATPNTPGSISPRFFDPETGDTVTLKRTGSVPSPDNSTSNIPWIQLEPIEGNLAKSVFRLQTAGGALDGPCKIEGNLRSVAYSAMYYFLN